MTLFSGSGPAKGDTAHGNADRGPPVKIGGTATKAIPDPVDESDRVQASFDLEGKLRTTTDSAIVCLLNSIDQKLAVLIRHVEMVTDERVNDTEAHHADP